MSPPRPAHGVLVREARLVPVGPGTRGAAIDRPVDLRIADGVVTEVGPDLPAVAADEVVDAAGRWAIPGLWDHRPPHHVVPDTGYREPRRDGWTRRRDASGSRPPRGADRRSLGWSVASGTGRAWNRLGTVAELDAVTGDVPVVLTSGDAHNGWLNSAALGLLGVAGVTRPLEENDWFRLQPAISALLEEIEEGGAEAALRSAMADAAARGSRVSSTSRCRAATGSGRAGMPTGSTCSGCRPPSTRRVGRPAHRRGPHRRPVVRGR